MLASWNHQYISHSMQPVQDTTMQLSWVFIAFYNQVFSRSPWFPLVLLSLHTFIRVCPRSPYCVHVLPSKVIIIDFWIDSFCKLNVTFTGLDRWARFPVKARIAGCPRIFQSKHDILYLRIRFVFSWQPTVQCSRICEINKKILIHFIDFSDSLQEESPKGCSCGKNTSRGGKAACKTSGTTSCSCVRKGKTCTGICICKNCCNAGQTVVTTADNSLNNMNITCRCGQNTAKNTSFVACQDGKRKSKCPCLGYGKGCSTACQCKGCGNIHGSSSRAPRSSVSGKRKRVEAIYRRENSSTFLRSAGMSTNAGP